MELIDFILVFVSNYLIDVVKTFLTYLFDKIKNKIIGNKKYAEFNDENYDNERIYLSISSFIASKLKSGTVYKISDKGSGMMVHGELPRNIDLDLFKNEIVPSSVVLSNTEILKIDNYVYTITAFTLGNKSSRLTYHIKLEYDSEESFRYFIKKVYEYTQMVQHDMITFNIQSDNEKWHEQALNINKNFSNLFLSKKNEDMLMNKLNL